MLADCLEGFDPQLAESCSRHRRPSWTPRYFFNASSQRCQQFWSDGCTSTRSRNNYDDLGVCQLRCAPEERVPSAWIHPLTSWPSVNGSRQPSASPISPGMAAMEMSEWHSPLPATRTRTCPGPGWGTGASVSSGAAPHSTIR